MQTENSTTTAANRLAGTKRKLISKIQLAFAWTTFYFVRGCERVLPITLFSWLLWPPAALFDLIHARERQPLKNWGRFPSSWRPKRWRYLLHQSLGLYHPQLFYMWPDRLTQPRWRKRCRFEGGEQLFAPEANQRGVVLASLHYGPFEILPYWLRANGIITASVRTAPPANLKTLTDYQYSLTPPAEIPPFIFAEDLTPMPRFSHIKKILAPGRRLLVMIDPARGLQADVPVEDRIFRMATGAIRLAAMANADLIPCLITEDSTWKFTVHFGEPVPREWLARSLDMQAIGKHLLGEFAKVVQRRPIQSKMRNARAWWPLPGEETADFPAFAPAVGSH